MPVDGGDAFQLGHRGLQPVDLHLNAQLIAGNHWLPELRFFHRSKEHDLPARLRSDLADQNAAHLRHRLDDHHARHHRKIWKVAGELRLVGSYVLDANNRVLANLGNAVNQQHRIAMRQDCQNLLDISSWHGKTYHNNRMNRFLSYAESILEPAIALIRELVECESPSGSTDAIERIADLLMNTAGEAAAPERLHNGHLILRFGPRNTGARQILLLGHSDTVWPVGTLAHMPFRRHDGRLWGPGVLDMKAGLVFALFAVRALGHVSCPITLLVVSDEEIGSGTSRKLIETEAARSRSVLVLEPGTGLSGSLKTARKGVGRYTVRVQGRAAHAGLDWEKGSNAIVEICRQVEAIAAFTDLPRGITVNPGVISGGTRTNVVPEAAHVEVDVRVVTQAQADEIDRRFRNLRVRDERCSLTVESGPARPPMERREGVAWLLEEARAVGRELGLAIEESNSGGGSDGSFTAALGVPTLDGLGAVGEGAHAANESILIHRIPDRIALLAGLLARLSDSMNA